MEKPGTPPPPPPCMDIPCLKLFQSRRKTQYPRYKKIGSTRPTRISVKILLNYIRTDITRSKVTPIPTYLQPSPQPQTMNLSPLYKKPMSGLPNRCWKHSSVSWNPKHNSSGSNAIIKYKHDRSSSDPMITEYTTKDAPSVAPQDSKHESSGSNTTMTYKR